MVDTYLMLKILNSQNNKNNRLYKLSIFNAKQHSMPGWNEDHWLLVLSSF